MSEVKFPQGNVKTGKGLGKSVNTLREALEIQADCTCGGINCCLGYWTMIDAADGTLKVMYIDNGTVVVDDYDTGIIALKVLYAARI